MLFIIRTPLGLLKNLTKTCTQSCPSVVQRINLHVCRFKKWEAIAGRKNDSESTEMEFEKEQIPIYKYNSIGC